MSEIKSELCFICKESLSLDVEREFGICKSDLHKIIDMIKNSAFMFGALR